MESGDRNEEKKMDKGMAEGKWRKMITAVIHDRHPSLNGH